MDHWRLGRNRECAGVSLRIVRDLVTGATGRQQRLHRPLTVLFGPAIVVGSGLIYMFLTRPFGRSAAPENDAIAYANKLNMGQDN